MEGSDRYCIRIIQIGQYARQASGSHGFAGARGTEQQQVMPSRSCHFQGTTQLGLATEIPQILFQIPGWAGLVGLFKKGWGTVTDALGMNYLEGLFMVT
jgi:hypothetical protein